MLTMLDTITMYGVFAHGDDPESVATEWEQAGFTADEAADWIGTARCFDAEAARWLRDASVTPDEAALEIDTDPPDPDDEYAEDRRPTLDGEVLRVPAMGRETVGYLVANRDLSAADAAALVRAR